MLTLHEPFRYKRVLTNLYKIAVSRSNFNYKTDEIHITKQRLAHTEKETFMLIIQIK